MARTHDELTSVDTATFDLRCITSDRSLGGSVQLVMRRTGDFDFTTSVHLSGLNNFDYVVSAVLVATSGIALTFQHVGHVEGTNAGPALGPVDRDDQRTTSERSPVIAREFDAVFAGARVFARLDAKDELVGGVTNAVGELLADAAALLGKAAVAAAVALVA